MAELRWGSGTDTGQVRDANEDHLFAGDNLFVVADGMGGHLAGEVASEIAVDTLNDRLGSDDRSTIDDLVTAITDANTAIYDDANSQPEHAGMGTTITALALVDDPYDGESFGVANVGDSRVYLLRHGRLRQVSVDHSFVQELVAEGAITREEARHHPRRNIVTRGLGIEPYVRVDSWTMPIIRGDRFLLCSDGLSDYVHDDDILAIVQRHDDDPQGATDELIAAANEAGGPDNITVVLVEVLEGDDPPDPTEEFDIVPRWDDGDDLADTGETEIIADPLPDDEDDPTAADDDSTDDTDGDSDEAPRLPSANTPIDPVSAEAAAAAAVAASDEPAAPTAPVKASRASRLVKFVLTVGVVAVIVGSFTILAAWARSGYFVDFDENGVVYVYQGRPDPVLWFQPTPEYAGAFTRDELTPQSIALVEERPKFSTLESATRWVGERLDEQGETPPTTAPSTTAPPTTSPSTTPPSTPPTTEG